MSAINREDAIEVIMTRLVKRKEPCPPWIYATIRECLDDLPSLPSTEPLVHDGFYLCDKKPGACPSWERKGWTKCESKHCNRTSRVDHALKLPDDGWIPCSERFPEEDGQYLITVKYKHVDGYEDIYAEHGEWSGGKWDMFSFGHCGEVESILAWRELPKPYEPKEDK